MLEVSEIPLYVLQGIVFAVAGWLVYQAGENGFLSRGKFRSKEFAQIIVILFLLFTGAGSSYVFDALQGLSLNVSLFEITTITIALSRAYINEMVDNWTHKDRRSIAAYAVGALGLVSVFV
jgi:hypothetical protein